MNYAREELIGRGGMSEVYRGRALTDDLAASGLPQGAPVALKYLNDQYLADAEIKERFFQEAQLCNRLQNPNIVRVHDVDLDGDRPFLVMDLVSGESLRARLRRGALPENEAVAIALGVLRALEAAHANGIVHRDIKPGNILPGPGTASPEAVRVTDFGIAKVLGGAALTVVGTQLGTPDYMSPEQMMGGRVDARCDIYSLGVVLYEMLSGATPFAAASSAEVSRKVLSEAPPPLPPHISRRVCEVVLRALQKDPTARYPSARDMRAVLELAQNQLSQPQIQPPQSADVPRARSPQQSQAAASFAPPKPPAQVAAPDIEYSIPTRSQNQPASKNSRSLMTWGALGLGALVLVALTVGQNKPQLPSSETDAPSISTSDNNSNTADNSLASNDAQSNDARSHTRSDTEGDAESDIGNNVAVTNALGAATTNNDAPTNVLPSSTLTPVTTPEATPAKKATPTPVPPTPTPVSVKSTPTTGSQLPTKSSKKSAPSKKVQPKGSKKSNKTKRHKHIVSSKPTKKHKTSGVRPQFTPKKGGRKTKSLHSYVF